MLSVLGLMAVVATAPALATPKPKPRNSVVAKAQTPPTPRARPSDSAADAKKTPPKPSSRHAALAELERDGLKSAALNLPPGIDPQPPENRQVKRVQVRSGDTLQRILSDAGIDRSEGQMAIKALTKLFNPRDLRIGQEIALELAGRSGPPQSATDPNQLWAIRLEESVERHVEAVRTAYGDFASREIKQEFETELIRVGGEIHDSLFLSARRAGLPDGITVRFIRLLSFDVDFQRGIYPGDRFEVIFERLFDDNRQPVKDGVILSARLTQAKRNLTYYRYVTADDGIADYFDEKGRSIKKTLMRTPIDGARLTSRFGRRKHPILGYNKLHPGVDFAAARGTPIMAAGDGVVEVAARKGGYGKYVRIRHNNNYKTAYAHMQRFARGIKSKRRVKQGQIIGYVGSTGRSTGPHLHYEVHLNGKRINPLAAKVPTGRRLKGKELARFKAALSEMKSQIAATPLRTKIAEAATASPQ